MKTNLLLFLVFAGSAAWCGAAERPEPAWRVGLAKVRITPENPMPMAGYGPRLSDGVLDDLYAKAMAVESVDGTRAVLVTADVLFFRKSIAEAIVRAIGQKTGLSPAQVLLTASHTHSGPLVGVTADLDAYAVPAEQRPRVAAYAEKLVVQLADLVAAAIGDLRSARLSFGSGQCDFVMNRRLASNRGVVMSPNPAGPVDRVVPVLKVETAEGRLRALVFACACHPVTLGGGNRKLSGDYAGMAQQAIERTRPGVQAMFMYGCGGDANSNPRGDATLVRQQGERLAAEVTRVASGSLAPVRSPLRIAFERVDLPLEHSWPRTRWEEIARGPTWHARNAKAMLQRLDRGQTLPESYRAPLTVWRLGAALSLVGVPGEAVCEYASSIRKAVGTEGLLIASCANESFGYLPTAKILREGGHESMCLTLDHGFFRPEVEQVVVAKVAELAGRGQPASAPSAAKSNSGPAGQLVIENDFLRLRFAAAGELASVFDKKAGRELGVEPGRTPLFRLELSELAKPTAKVSLASGDAAKVTVDRSRPGTMQLHFTGIGHAQASAVCSFSTAPGDRYVRCRISVEVPAGLVLESVRFPDVVLRTPTGEQGADALVLGATKGGVWRGVSGWKTGRTVSGKQPGNLTAQFGCYYDPAGGLMTATFDARGYGKTVAASRTREGLSLNWQQVCFERSRFAQAYDIGLTTFASPDAARPADWRDAADLYKQWAVRQRWCERTFAQRDDLPAWLKQGPAMVRFGREWLAKPERIERWLRTCWPEYASGVPLVVAYWGWEKHGSWVTPDYFPVFPSDEQFARLVRVGRECGGHAFLWPSGYHYTLTYQKQPDGTFEWDDRARFDSQAAPHAIHTRDGRPLIGDRFWLGGGQTATMCPGDPWTIAWFNRTATGCVARGAELVQVDQVVGGGFPICYRADHGHPAGAGLWMSDAFSRQMETMLAACRKIDPQSVVCVEEPNEWFLHQVGIQDYRDWEVMRRGGAEPASVFNYIYHEYVPTFQSNPRAGDRLMVAHCIADGQMPHIVPWPHFEPGPLLVDGGLEEYAVPGARGWSKVNGYAGRDYSGRATRDESVRHGGRASLRLESNDGEIVQVSQNVAPGEYFAAGRKYRLSAWMKTAEMARSNAIGLAALAGQTQSAGSWHIPFPKPGDWVQGAVEFTLPESAQALRIMLHVNGRARLWVDDVRLEAVLPNGRTVEVEHGRHPADQRVMHDWIELYHGRGRPWLQLGRMLHPPRLDCATIEIDGRRFSAVQHNAFATPNGSEAVILANATSTPQHAKLTWHGKAIPLDLAPEEIRLLNETK